MKSKTLILSILFAVVTVAFMSIVATNKQIKSDSSSATSSTNTEQVLVSSSDTSSFEYRNITHQVVSFFVEQFLLQKTPASQSN